MNDLVIPVNKVQPQAARRLSVEIQKRLVQRNFNDRRNLLHELFHMVQDGNIDLLRSISDSVKKSLWKKLDPEGKQHGLLHYAAMNDDVATTRFLIEEHRLDVNVKNSKLETPLHLCAKYGHTNVMYYLLQSPKIQIDSKNYYKKTAIHLAVRYSNINCIQLLLLNSADKTIKDFKNRSLIHIAMKSNNLEILQALNVNSTMLKEQEINGLTPLMIAAIEGTSEAFEMSLQIMTKSGSDAVQILDMQDNEGFTCLMHAVNNKHSRIMVMCIRAGTNVCLQTEDGLSALHIAASTNFEELFETISLYRQKAKKVSIFDGNRNTPLHISCENNFYNISKYLLELGANPNLWNRNFIYPIHILCLLNQEKHKSLTNQELSYDGNSIQLAHIDLLLQYDSDIIRRDKQMRNVLHLATNLGNLPLVKHLIQKLDNNNINKLVNQGDKSGKTPLHYAAQIGHLDICQLLMNNGADACKSCYEFKYPVHKSIVNRHIDCVKYLITIMTVTNKLEISSKRQALLLSCETGSLEILQYLDLQRFDLNSRDTNYRNGLMLAADKSHYDVIEYLLSRGISIDSVDMLKNTALHYACYSGSTAMVKLLLDNQAELTLNDFDLSPIDVALLVGNFETAKVFFDDKRWLSSIEFRHLYRNSHFNTLIETNEDMAVAILNRCVKKIDEDKLDSSYKISNDFSVIDPDPHDPTTEKGLHSPLMTMAKFKRSKLLNHELSKALLQRKWLRLGLVYLLIDLLIYLIFLISLTTYMLINDPPTMSSNKKVDSSTGCFLSGNDTSKSKEDTSDAERWLIALLFIIMIVRVLVLLVSLLSQRLQFFLSMQNYITIVMFVMSFMFIHDPGKKPCVYEWPYGSVAILLAWFLLIFYFIQIPIIGRYIIMFEYVLKRVVLVLLMFFCIFFGFAMSFFITLRKDTAFSRIDYSLMKVFGMTLGEFELTTYFLDSDDRYYAYTTSIMYMFFLVMPITLISLVVGIAVGGIEELEREASLQAVITKVTYVSQIEAMLPWYLIRKMHVPLVISKGSLFKK